MAAKDGSMSFDFSGTYDSVEVHQSIKYTIDDGRKVTVTFTNTTEGVLIQSDFEPETNNPDDMQQGGWQAILNSFKEYAEANA